MQQFDPLKAETTRWMCPAKLNLFLHFIGQRKDGYHLLQSYFQLLDFGDRLEITLNTTGKIKFSCDEPTLGTKNNLVTKAAVALQKQMASGVSTQRPLGADLHLIKQLPVGGGVGGGSSDCATTLIALNHLWGTGLSIAQLAKLGEWLGADVPFFVRGQSAFVEGIGEKITPFAFNNSAINIYYLVVQPGCQVSTAKIFSDPQLTRNTKAITIRDLKLMRLPFEGLNTMQSLVVEANPQIKEALEWLQSHSRYTRMTGSGSCLFSVFDNLEDASKIAALCDPSWQTFVARGTKVSKLFVPLENSV